MEVEIITTSPPPPIPPRPYVFALTHNSLFNTSDSYSKSVGAYSWFRYRLAVYS